MYFSFTGKPGDPGGKNIPRVGRGRLDRANLKIVGVEIIIDGAGSQEIHFTPDGKLLVSGAGDVFKDDAQDLGITFGKLLRYNPDGSVPGDNPWNPSTNVRPEIFSFGHRDISGFASHPETGETWITEHDPPASGFTSCLKSTGRFARSGAIITHLPTIGSFRSSGIVVVHSLVVLIAVVRTGCCLKYSGR